MSTSTPSPKEIHTALLSAFPNKGSLSQMVRFHLDMNLDEIAGGNSLSDIVFDLMQWAEAHGKLDALISGALAANPNNPALKLLSKGTSVSESSLDPAEGAGEQIGGDKITTGDISNATGVAMGENSQVNITNNYYRTQTSADSETESPGTEPLYRRPEQRPVEIPTVLESPMGTMSPESPFYVMRPADNECTQIFSSGNPFTLYIQAPRQMGKSSLMQRMLYVAQQERASLNVAYVDFEKISSFQLADIDQFLIGLCVMIGRELKVPEKIDDYWASKYQSPLIKCSDYIFDYLLGSVEGHVVIAMDEVEKVLGLPFQDDFFGMLRTWHNDRARDKNMARCCLFLSSSTEPELFIENPNQSPFNVAHLMELRSFSQDAVAYLNELHNSPLQAAEIDQLYSYLGGHPYLTRQALYTIASNGMDCSQLLTQATFDDSPFRTHLQNLWRHLEDRAELRSALGQIINNGKHPADRTFYRLKGAGLVRRDGEGVLMCNQLYTDYFAQYV